MAWRSRQRSRMGPFPASSFIRKSQVTSGCGSCETGSWPSRGP